ncbi:MAG: trypsin-like peptidase domain-containing protein [Rickettsiales bacterium]|nr:trypsin-like peptidase domain-containing protein [Rickettsiales bacterium]
MKSKYAAVAALEHKVGHPVSLRWWRGILLVIGIMWRKMRDPEFVFVVFILLQYFLGMAGGAGAVSTAAVRPTLEGTGTSQIELGSRGNANYADESQEVASAWVADIVGSALPAVVTLRALRVKQNYDQNYFAYRDQLGEMGIGSGFFIDEDGTILTSSHLVDYSDGIIVKVGNREIQAELVGQDRVLDVALLKVNLNGRKAKFLDLKADVPVRIGDSLVVIGNPYDLGPTVSLGIVSAPAKAVPDSGFSYNYIQTDVVLRPGNSGGPVLNRKGEVLGLSTFIRSLTTDDKFGIGFILPLDSHVLDAVDKLKKLGYSQNGYLGVAGLTLGYEHAHHMKILGFKRKAGVLVIYLDKNGPAAKAGLLLNDIIVSYDGNRVDDQNMLVNMVANTAVGSRVELLIFRGGKYIKLRVQIEEDPRDTRDITLNRLIKDNSLEIFDMFMSQMCEELAEKHEIYAKQGGMYVLDVKKGGWADLNGIERGDMLLTANQTQIKTKRDLLQFFDNMRLNGQREFIMLFKKYKTRESVLIKANLSLIDH